jgi:hypothetical protein
MFNELQLSDIEEKQIKNDVAQLTRQEKLEIDYYIQNEFNVGGDSSGSWQGYQWYDCSFEKISDYNIKKYPYGNLFVGDIVINLPYDTLLEKEADDYRFKYDNKVYHAKGDLLEQRFFCVLVGEL